METSLSYESHETTDANAQPNRRQRRKYKQKERFVNNRGGHKINVIHFETGIAVKTKRRLQAILLPDGKKKVIRHYDM